MRARVPTFDSKTGTFASYPIRFRSLQSIHIAEGSTRHMRIVVDLNRCQGYAQCVPLAPDVLQLNGEEALMYDPNPDDSQRLRVLRAAASCPVQAIIVDQLDESRGTKAMSDLTSEERSRLVQTASTRKDARPDRHRRRFAGGASGRRRLAKSRLYRPLDHHRR